MVEDFQNMDTKFGHDRKTRILQEDGQVNEMDLIINARSGVNDGETERCCPFCLPLFLFSHIHISFPFFVLQSLS
jgi:hypothetical protein